MKRIVTLLLVATCVFTYAQSKPKLVVGIIVDQMRADYISKYWDKFGDGGFKRLRNEGFNCNNTHYNYVPTFTGPGHASVYTGTTPAVHGIIANEWYEKYGKTMLYCAQDDGVNTVGSNSAAGKMSPKNLKASTITDELKLSNEKSKVFAVSLKDRGAIMPGGHAADGSFWFDGEMGVWVSSTHYMNNLPGWVEGINKANPAEAFIKAGWNTLLTINQYTESYKDDNPYEGKFEGEDKPTFPHDLTGQFAAKKYDAIKYTPFGNTLTRMFAESILENESVGKDNVTDFLAISFSATDYVGHKFGPHSIEVEDTYLRLDKDLEALLKVLDTQVGTGNYTLFLTADHAAVEVPSYLMDKKQAAGYIEHEDLQKELNDVLVKKYGAGEWVENVSNGQIFLTDKLKTTKNSTEYNVILENYLMKQEGVAAFYTREQVLTGSSELPSFKALKLGFNPKASGDVVLLFEPGWINDTHGKTGTTHGSPYNYDTHVPLIWFGKGIKKGSTTERVDITDIAPTLSFLLGINIPNGAIGQPIKQVVND